MANQMVSEEGVVNSCSENGVEMMYLKFKI